MAYNKDLHHLIYTFTYNENLVINEKLKSKKSVLQIYKHYRKLKYESNIKNKNVYSEGFSKFKNLKNTQTELKNFLFRIVEEFEIRNIEDEVWLNIRKARSLFNRCSYKFALQQLKKAKTLALNNELFELLIIVNMLENVIALAGKLPIPYLDTKTLLEERESYILKVLNLLDYYFLKDDLTTFLLQNMSFRNPEEVEGIVNEISSNKLYVSEEFAKTKRAKYILYDLQRMMAMINENPQVVIEKVMQMEKNLLSLPKEYNTFLPKNYAVVYLLMIQENYLIGNFDDAKYWKALDNIKGRNRRLDVFLYKTSSFMTLRKMTRNGSISDMKVHKKVQEIENGFKTFVLEMDAEGKFIIPYMLTIFWFAQENFTKAQFWINQFFAYQKLRPQLRKDVLKVSKLLELGILLENKEYASLKDKALKTRKKFKSNNVLYKSEKVLLDFFYKSNHFTLNKKETSNSFETLYDNLKALADDCKQERQYHQMNVDWMAWAKKKF